MLNIARASAQSIEAYLGKPDFESRLRQVDIFGTVKVRVHSSFSDPQTAVNLSYDKTILCSPSRHDILI